MSKWVSIGIIENKMTIEIDFVTIEIVFVLNIAAKIVINQFNDNNIDIYKKVGACIGW